jgi:6-phosphogluconolactonase (cycloisomerase 2 family)
MRMKCRFVASLLLGSLAVLTSCSNTTPTSNPVASGSGFLWVAAQGNNTLSAFTLDLTTGNPTQDGNSIDGGLAPSAMVITPDGSAIFVASKTPDTNGNYDISSYAVKTDGTLTAGSNAPLTNVLPSVPVSLALDPTGKILFVANQGADDISVFSISGTSLTELAGSPFSDVDPNNPVVTGPTSLAITPSGNYLYVANQFTSSVSAFQYDSTGALSPLSPFTYQAGTNPSAVAISRTVMVNSQTTQPHFLYVANSGSNNVSGFSICDVVSPNCLNPSGRLTQLSDSPYPAGINPVYIAVNPVYNGVYVVDEGSNEISMFKWASDTGSLTVLSPPSISTGATPTWAQVHPDGVWVYVANTGATSVSIYGVGIASPLLGPIAAGPFTVSPQPSALVLR